MLAMVHSLQILQALLLISGLQTILISCYYRPCSAFASVPATISRRSFVVETTIPISIMTTNTSDNHPSNTGSSLKGGYTSDVTPAGGKFWNRETSVENDYSGKVTNEARIVCLSDPNDPNNDPLYHKDLPEGCRLVAVGASYEEFDLELLQREKPNVVFVSHPKSREPLAKLLDELPSIEWIHSRSAGIDFIVSETLSNKNVIVTNAKGMYSSTLAEYTMMAISYFAKDLPRLMQQKQNKEWIKYPVEEIRGKTLGIIGYGDIGRAAAKLANAYGMKVIALRRRPKLSHYDPYCNEVLHEGEIHTLMQRSDYVLIAAPLTTQTKGMISKKEFANAKSNSVIINVGRGPIIDEPELIEALNSNMIRGAALDVTSVEPLPETSPLWTFDNVLLSPHNMDMTVTFMKESTEFFVRENLPRYVRNIPLLNPVDKVAGY